MSSAAVVKEVVISSLQLDPSTELHADTPLLGAIPEFDSMAVVTILTQLEEAFDMEVDDDEISAEVFETFGALVAFVEQKQ